MKIDLKFVTIETHVCMVLSGGVLGVVGALDPVHGPDCIMGAVSVLHLLLGVLAQGVLHLTAEL